MSRVSVCLPNLNNRRFLPERLETIFAQTFTDWELVVVDNFSDDGAWEYFQEQAAREPRMRISQAPREGMYANWNNCLRLARGEYVYIATSDDTMLPDCLEKLVCSLDKHPECSIANSCLITIDGEGRTIPGSWEGSFVTQFFGDWMKRSHIREAPHDGLLYCAERCVYTSITQVLIRRDTFEKVGFFRTDLGSEGDWEWEMRASLLVNTVHVPEFLATWRVHPEQATQYGKRATTPEWHTAVDKMIRQAVAAATKIQPELAQSLDVSRMTFFARRNFLRSSLRRETSALGKIRAVIRNFASDPALTFSLLLRRLFSTQKPVADDFTWTRQLIDETVNGRTLLRDAK